ncbi:hypothetical protein L1887_54157 [Cichorium endivia]|nr:hypothetical protein L1887_54157 [Cichorium endivia]
MFGAGVSDSASPVSFVSLQRPFGEALPWLRLWLPCPSFVCHPRPGGKERTIRAQKARCSRPLRQVCQLSLLRPGADRGALHFSRIVRSNQAGCIVARCIVPPRCPVQSRRKWISLPLLRVFRSPNFRTPSLELPCASAISSIR